MFTGYQRFLSQNQINHCQDTYILKIMTFLLKMNSFLGNLPNVWAKAKPHVQCHMHSSQIANIGTHQCFFFSRKISSVTPKVVIHFHYLKKYFLDQSIQKNIPFHCKTEALVPTIHQCFCSSRYIGQVSPNVFHLFLKMTLLQGWHQTICRLRIFYDRSI